MAELTGAVPTLQVVPGPLYAAAVAPAFVFAASADAPAWVDYASRLGVIGLLLFAGFALHRRWWVPGWTHADLERRHERLARRYDALLEVALQSSRGVTRTATILEAALESAAEPERR